MSSKLEGEHMPNKPQDLLWGGMSMLGCALLCGRCTPLADADALGLAAEDSPATETNPATLGSGTPAGGTPGAAAAAPGGTALPAAEGTDISGMLVAPTAPRAEPAAPGSQLEGDPADPNEGSPPLGGMSVADAGLPEPEPPPLEDCEFGQSRLDQSCYRASFFALPWPQARTDCQTTGADLVVIESAEEDRFVADLLDSTIWIGASDQLLDNAFVWVDGSAIAFASWGDQEPTAFAGLDDCVQKRQEPNERWYDQPCDDPYFYVCESSVTP